jgi:hypothetical protein
MQLFLLIMFLVPFLFGLQVLSSTFDSVPLLGQVCIWIYLGINDNAAVELASKLFIVAVSFVALLGFSVYGGRYTNACASFPCCTVLQH